MLKFGSFLVATAVMAMFTGCESKPKTDAELAVAAFKKGFEGDQSSFTMIIPSKTHDEIENDGINHCAGFPTIAKMKTSKNCQVEFRKMSKSGKYAVVYRACGELDQGDGYLEKVDGEWKVLVRD